MSQIAPEVGRYLQMRARAWLKEDTDRTATDLARATKVNKERISVLLSTGAVGLAIAKKIAPFFGFANEWALGQTATEWAKNEPPSLPSPGSQVRLPLALHERLSLATALAIEDGATEDAARSVFAELAGVEARSVLKLAILIARRQLEMDEGIRRSEAQATKS